MEKKNEDSSNDYVPLLQQFVMSYEVYFSCTIKSVFEEHWFEKYFKKIRSTDSLGLTFVDGKMYIH